MDKHYYVYIITNQRNSTFYIGITNNLERRIYEHKQGMVKGFSKQYNLNKLVYFEETENVISAISREKYLKKWNRKCQPEAGQPLAEKLRLIEKKNPKWEDLSKKFFLEALRSPLEPAQRMQGEDDKSLYKLYELYELFNFINFLSL